MWGLRTGASLTTWRPAARPSSRGAAGVINQFGHRCDAAHAIARRAQGLRAIALASNKLQLTSASGISAAGLCLRFFKSIHYPGLLWHLACACRPAFSLTGPVAVVLFGLVVEKMHLGWVRHVDASAVQLLVDRLQDFAKDVDLARAVRFRPPAKADDVCEIAQLNRDGFRRGIG